MKLTIIGASGHGRVIADIAIQCGYDEIEFLDDNKSIHFCGEWKVVGRSNKAADVENALFVAIGNAKIRKRLMEKYAEKNMPVLIHPSAVVSSYASIGRGTVIMAGTVVNPYAVVGQGCIINTCASIDHDCVIEDYVHIAVGAHLCGTVNVGMLTWIGAGATISNNISVFENCKIGAGAVVVHDIEEEGTYVGVPAKKMSKSKLTRGGGSSAYLKKGYIESVELSLWRNRRVA